MVNKIEVVQPEGSHHFILYQSTDDNPPPPGVRDLDPIEALGIFRKRFVVGSQSPEAVFDFPEGIAIPMPADAVYELNSHFVNTSGENTLIGEVYVNLHTMPADSVRVAAKPIFINNFGISVPPGRTETTARDWTLERDVNVIMLSSHMHQTRATFRYFPGGRTDISERGVGRTGDARVQSGASGQGRRTGEIRVHPRKRRQGLHHPVRIYG